MIPRFYQFSHRRHEVLRGSYGQSETRVLLANKEPYGASPASVDASILIAIVALVLVTLIAVAVVVPV